MTKSKVVSIDCFQLRSAESIEDVLCLATLFSMGEVDDTPQLRATIQDAKEWRETRVDDDCDKCPYNVGCLACSING